MFPWLDYVDLAIRRCWDRTVRCGKPSLSWWHQAWWHQAWWQHVGTHNWLHKVSLVTGQ